MIDFLLISQIPQHTYNLFTDINLNRYSRVWIHVFEVSFWKSFWLRAQSFLKPDYSTHQLKQPFTDVLQNSVLKNFTIFTEKHLRWSFFLIKLQAWKPATLLKRVSNLGVFLWIFWEIFKSSCFYRSTPMPATSGLQNLPNYKKIKFKKNKKTKKTKENPKNKNKK